jgi:DMSO/TMAO reductase YedYZ heme-binding membrane subunit
MFTIRKAILVASLIYAVVLTVLVFQTTPIASLQLIKLSRYSGLSSLVFLYVSLMISPVLLLWPTFPYRAELKSARRAIGVAGWGFAAVHGIIGFFGQLGGFAGLPFLSQNYQIATLLGTVSLLILTALAATSTDWALRKLQFHRWKLLHRFVYLSTVLTVIHTLMMGTHFRDLSTWMPQIFFFFLSILIFLEIIRFALFVLSRNQLSSFARLIYTVGIPVVSFVFVFYIQTQQNIFSVHPKHQTENSDHNSGTRYRLIAKTPVLIETEKPTPIRLEIYDWDTRTALRSFFLMHHQSMHLVIVNDTLDWFSHVHPVRTNIYFDSVVTFPKGGTYYAYATVNPENVGDLTLSTTLQVTGDPKAAPPTSEDSSIKVTMTSKDRLAAADLISGKEKIRFVVKDAKSGIVLPTIEEYLGDLGHLVMINRDTLEYMHIHPDLKKEKYEQLTDTGKEIPFIVDSTHTNIKKGSYRLFVEFAHNARIHTNQFDLELE